MLACEEKSQSSRLTFFEPERAATSATAAAPFFGSRATRTTSAPRRAMSTAASSPIPEFPPVMSAVLPPSLISPAPFVVMRPPMAEPRSWLRRSHAFRRRGGRRGLLGVRFGGGWRGFVVVQVQRRPPRFRARGRHVAPAVLHEDVPRLHHEA